MLAYLIALFLATASGLQLRSSSHDYWYLKDNPVVAGSDSKWDYCDLKCLYLERYEPDKDFVVIVLTATLHDTFAACYVKTPEGFTLWNKVLTNTFFQDHCGGDYKDWANNGEFNIKGVYGEGIGTQIPENATYA